MLEDSYLFTRWTTTQGSSPQYRARVGATVRGSGAYGVLDTIPRPRRGNPGWLPNSRITTQGYPYNSPRNARASIAWSILSARQPKTQNPHWCLTNAGD